MNSLILPFSIHSDTITNCLSSIVTPRRGNTFGWLRAFHLIASLQNLCVGCGQLCSLVDAQATHPSNFGQVTRQVYPQNLGCDSPASMTTHPHICTAASVLRDFQSVVAKRDLKRSWK